MSILGRWRIVEMELWDEDAIDLLGPSGRDVIEAKFIDALEAE